jgi:hypothetical protein
LSATLQALCEIEAAMIALGQSARLQRAKSDAPVQIDEQRDRTMTI